MREKGGGWRLQEGGKRRRRWRRRRQGEGLMVTVAVGGQLEPETYDRHTQTHNHAQTHTHTDAHLGNPTPLAAPHSHTQKDPWRGSD